MLKVTVITEIKATVCISLRSFAENPQKKIGIKILSDKPWETYTSAIGQHLVRKKVYQTRFFGSLSFFFTF